MASHPEVVTIRSVGGDELDVVLAANVFDNAPRRAWAEDFLARPGHHLVLAFVEGVAVGFVSGIEIAHPDKAVEMLLYELGVIDEFRRRGIGRGLVGSLLAIARRRGCREMWVPVDADDAIAVATYRSSGAGALERASILSWRLEPDEARGFPEGRSGGRA